MLILVEKHGRRYFHVPDEAALFAASLRVLTERFESGWYRTPESAPLGPDVGAADVPKLPASLREVALGRIEAYKVALDYYRRKVDEHEAVAGAVKSGDGAAAYRVLLNRRGVEYEGFVLEPYEDVGPIVSTPDCRGVRDPEAHEA